MMTLGDQYAFFYAVLEKLGLKPTYNRMELMLCWANVESTAAKNNPLATTWDMAPIDKGQTNFNWVPVRNYSTAAIGVQATANTIKSAYYPHIQAALKADQSVHSLSATDPGLIANFKTWGGIGTYWQTLKQRAAGTAGQSIAAFVKKNSTQSAGTGLKTTLLIIVVAWGFSQLSQRLRTAR